MLIAFWPCIGHLADMQGAPIYRPSQMIHQLSRFPVFASTINLAQVGRGQKLGENAEGMPFSDMTVEDLLKIIRNLSPEESAVSAVSTGLYYLDSRALAALLKELHKLGLTNRYSLATLGVLLPAY